jgi:hypothetical protein
MRTRYWVTRASTLIRQSDDGGTFDYVGRTTGGAWVERNALIDRVKDPMVDAVDAGFAAMVAAYWGARL